MKGQNKKSTSMSDGKKLIAAIVLLASFTLLGYWWTSRPVVVEIEKGNLGSFDKPFINTNFAAAGVNVSTTRQLVADIRSGAQVRSFCNIGSDSVPGGVVNFPVYLHFTSASTTVATSTGRPVYAPAQGGGYCYDLDFYYEGQVWAISNTSTVQRISTNQN